MSDEKTDERPQPFYCDLDDLAHLSRLSESGVRDAILRGELPAREYGAPESSRRRILVRRSDALTWLESFPEYQPQRRARKGRLRAVESAS